MKTEPGPVDALRSRADFHTDQIEQLAFELAFELEEAEMDRNDFVTVNRDKLKAIASRILARLTPEPTAPSATDRAVVNARIDIVASAIQEYDNGPRSNCDSAEQEAEWDRSASGQLLLASKIVAALSAAPDPTAGGEAVALKEGWLARDVAKAAKRVRQWDAHPPTAEALTERAVKAEQAKRSIDRILTELERQNKVNDSYAESIGKPMSHARELWLICNSHVKDRTRELREALRSVGEEKGQS